MCQKSSRENAGLREHRRYGVLNARTAVFSIKATQVHKIRSIAIQPQNRAFKGTIKVDRHPHLSKRGSLCPSLLGGKRSSGGLGADRCGLVVTSL